MQFFSIPKHNVPVCALSIDILITQNIIAFLSFPLLTLRRLDYKRFLLELLVQLEMNNRSKGCEKTSVLKYLILGIIILASLDTVARAKGVYERCLQ